MTMQSKPCVECVYNLEEEPGLVCYPSGLRQKCAHCVEKNEQCIRVPPFTINNARAVMRAAFAVRDANKPTQQQQDDLCTAVRRFQIAVRLHRRKMMNISPFECAHLEIAKEQVVALREIANACRHVAHLEPYRWAPLLGLPDLMGEVDDSDSDIDDDLLDLEEEEEQEEEAEIKTEPKTTCS